MRQYLFELQERRLLWDVHKQHSAGNSEALVRAAAAAAAVGAEVVNIPPPTSLTNARGHDGVLYPPASQISSPLREEEKRNPIKGETEQIQSSVKRKSEVLTAAAYDKQDALECDADN